MANPQTGTAAGFRRDVETAGANLMKETEAAVGRVGDEFQRAKEQIAETAASGRDDLSADLKKLSKDVANLKDTVAEMVKALGSDLGDAASDLGAEIASSAKEEAGAMVAELERVARRNPLAVVTGALCLGLVIGLISGRR
jgi:CHASE3 domain sensor protein